MTNRRKGPELNDGKSSLDSASSRIGDSDGGKAIIKASANIRVSDGVGNCLNKGGGSGDGSSSGKESLKRRHDWTVTILMLMGRKGESKLRGGNGIE